jgi:hypothetical protein
MSLRPLAPLPVGATQRKTSAADLVPVAGSATRAEACVITVLLSLSVGMIIGALGSSSEARRQAL